MDSVLKEITFQVRQEEDGGYVAAAVEEDIITQGDDWDELKYMIKDAVRCHFGERETPETIRIELVHEAETISV